MFRLFAFILTCLGGINWLMIGSLQYDFVAGIFGTQSNVFSRIIYFIIGICSVYILAVTLFSKARARFLLLRAPPSHLWRAWRCFDAALRVALHLVQVSPPASCPAPQPRCRE